MHRLSTMMRKLWITLKYFIYDSTGKMTINESDLQYIDDGNKQSGKLQKLLDEQGNKLSLLVIDDNNDIRQYVRTLLQDEFYVFEASDGKEGLDIARKEVPDLVICDVMMPVMNGLEFTEQLKTQTITSHIPVIMLTAKNWRNIVPKLMSMVLIPTLPNHSIARFFCPV